MAKPVFPTELKISHVLFPAENSSLGLCIPENHPKPITEKAFKSKISNGTFFGLPERAPSICASFSRNSEAWKLFAAGFPETGKVSANYFRPSWKPESLEKMCGGFSSFWKTQRKFAATFPETRKPGNNLRQTFQLPENLPQKISSFSSFQNFWRKFALSFPETRMSWSKL